MSQITLIVEFAVKPGQDDAYRAVSERMRTEVERAEPGTLRYEWWLDEAGARGFNLEVFAESSALAHHMENTAGMSGDLLATADVVRVEVLGELDETGHTAIDAAATGYFRLLGGISR